MRNDLGRRDFIRRVTAGAVSAGAAIASVPRNVIGANDRVIVGGVGTGRQGTYDLQEFSRQPDVTIAAICDVYQPNLQQCFSRIGPNNPQTYKDYRQLLDRKDIDVVVVGTPDHWHPLVMVDACKAGKDVYVEKPLSHTVDEGKLMVEAARKYQRVVQVGTQQRSGVHFQEAARLIQQGYIGKVSFVRTWNYSNQYPQGIGDPPDSDPPAGLDWDFWQGPAPAHTFNPNRFGVAPGKWSTFRYFWDYAGGVMTDWGVHLMDIVQMCMQVEGPEVITALGGRFFIHDNATTPDTLQVTYRYPNFIAVYENRWSNANSMEKPNRGYGMEFHGTDATLYVNREGFEVYPEKRTVDGREETVGAAMKMKRVNDAHRAHVRNFLDCVKSRAHPVSDVAIGNRSTAVCLLGNVAFRSGQRLEWDVANQKLREPNSAAEKFLVRHYREPWKLSV